MNTAPFTVDFVFGVRSVAVRPHCCIVCSPRSPVHLLCARVPLAVQSSAQTASTVCCAGILLRIYIYKRFGAFGPAEAQLAWPAAGLLPALVSTVVFLALVAERKKKRITICMTDAPPTLHENVFLHISQNTDTPRRFGMRCRSRPPNKTHRGDNGSCSGEEKNLNILFFITPRH